MDRFVPKGFRAAAVAAGIKPSGRDDLAAIVADADCAAAGVFTTNRVAAAPVTWDRARVPTAHARAVVVNAGNANAATGPGGLEDAATTAARAAAAIGASPDQVLVASTGVIGRRLPMPSLLEGLDRALASLSDRPDAFDHLARAIMTTDTRPKITSRRRSIGGTEVTLLGVAKGAAMIGPNMATMLAFLLTDAPVGPADLDATVRGAVEDSFHRISVEGHMSTNDTVLLLASGAAGGPALTGAALGEFRAMAREVAIELARMIPDDGEGATHLITIDVEGTADRAEAVKIARAVADSPLVKTAIAGADPNWGRIVSAAGYAGVPFAPEQLSLEVNGVPLYEAGAPVAFDEAAVSASIRSAREVHLRLIFTRGSAGVRFWTCDLTAEYVHINADYTT